ncbi:MAG: hypothetical protein Q8P90_01300 [bacterium]|nr:hypothetical protein [bacterium]
MFNILPPERKAQLKKEELYLIVKSSCIAIFVIFFLIDATLISTRFLLDGWLEKLQNDYHETTISEKLKTSTQQQLSNLKTTSDAFSNTDTQQINTLIIINSLLENIPSTSSLERLEIDSINKEVVLWGSTSNRSTLLELQESIENNPQFENFTFPVGDLSTKENINFNFTGNYVDEIN